jgi:anaerobic selenocysteine-containing dehydrogenase
MTTQHVRTFCRVCEPACGLVAEVRDGQLEKLSPDKAHPVSRGYACHKGLFGADIHRDPDRLDHPQRRTADGTLERISWEQAIAGIGAKLNDIRARHGASAIAGYLGNPGAYNALLAEQWHAFFGRLGSERLFNAVTQDCGNKFAGSEAVFGSVTVQPIPDFAHTRYLLLIGENPKVSQMSFVSLPASMDTLQAIEARGGKVVFVNPRHIESAKQTGEWLPIRPDTDVYFLAALLVELDRQGFFHEEILAGHGRHVEDLRAFIADYPPERVAPVTGISAERMQALAGEFGRAEGAAIHMSTGVNMGRQGTLAYWLLQMASFVTGNLDRPGGNVQSVGYYTRHSRAGRTPRGGIEFIDTPQGRIRRPQAPVFPVPGNLLPDLITADSDRIRALVVCAGNPVLSMGGEARLRAALPELELLVVIDLYRNATAEYAHYLLPATDAFEREDVNVMATGLQVTPYVQYTPAVVRARAERRPEHEVLVDLAAVMGLAPADSPAVDPWGKFAHMLRSRDLAFSELKASQVIEFGPHEHGRFFSDHLQTTDQKVDCCPMVFRERFPALVAEFQGLLEEPANTLKLISRREARMMNSWYSNIPRLRTRTNSFNPLYVHPEDARARGLADGDTARLRNTWGDTVVTVRLDEDLMPGVVAMAHGWGHQASPGMRVAHASPGVNCNRLLPTGPGSFDPLSGQAHMTGIAVALEPAQDDARSLDKAATIR